jgi:putative oxidoreductase
MTFFRTPALLIARIILGLIFIATGLRKLDSGLGTTADGFKSMGVPLPKVSAFFQTWLEIIGGGALILGILLPVFGTVMALSMIGAAYWGHWDNGFWMADGGYELTVALAAGLLAVGWANAGLFSVDHYLRKRRGEAIVVEGG